MKTRVRKHFIFDTWYAEYRDWKFQWKIIDSFIGDASKERAIECCKQFCNPIIEEVTK